MNSCIDIRAGFLAIQIQKTSWLPIFGKPGNSLKVVPDALVKVCLCTICIVWALFCDNAGPLGQAYVLKVLTQEAKQQWTIVLLRIQ
jgi:hypothetical protein